MRRAIPLSDYLLGACADKKARLTQQWNEATDTNTATCGCGLSISVLLLYRCLFCGEWFCVNCAEAHFGQTISEWTDQKRIEARAAAEKRRADREAAAGSNQKSAI